MIAAMAADLRGTDFCMFNPWPASTLSSSAQRQLHYGIVGSSAAFIAAALLNALALLDNATPVSRTSQLISSFLTVVFEKLSASWLGLLLALPCLVERAGGLRARLRSGLRMPRAGTRLLLYPLPSIIGMDRDR